MKYIVRITKEAINDIGVFYRNTVLKYPNTWTVHDAIAQADKVVDEISSAIIEGLDGYQSPLLVDLQTNEVVESSTEDNNWYYTVRLEGEYAIVENAVYKGNESNRAFRRGTAKPNFPLNKDHRNTPPVYNKNNTPYTVHKVLENGFSIVKSNSKNPLYSLVHTDTGQFVINDWFKNIKPLNLPYGKLGIIAYVNDNGSLSCLSSDGKLYGMNRSWNDAFTESKKLDSIIRRVIKEELNPTIPDAEYCVSHQKFDKSCGQKNAHTNCKYRRIGKYLIIKGDNQPHRIEGMEQYGKNLYDKAMYTAPDETICVFSVGEGTNKRICCRLEYDESTRMWLGFTPLEAKDVPVLIRQHIKDKSLNRW